MNIFKDFFDECIWALNFPLVIFGYEFASWQVFLLGALFVQIERLFWWLMDGENNAH